MNITQNASLKKFNTFGIDAKAKYFITAADSEEIIDAINFVSKKNIDLLPLGKGSNILFTKDFEGAVLHILPNDITITEENDSEVTIKVGAGVEWDDLVSFSVKRKFWGLENLSFIPGTAGAAPVQNIGAYGAELKDTLVKVTGIDVSKREVVSFTKEECEFGYRESIFKNKLKNKFIISEIEIKLSKKYSPNVNYRPLRKIFDGKKNLEPEEIRTEIIRIRKEKLTDPNEIGNAGSFFTNPIVDASVLQRIRAKYPSIPFYNLPDGKFKIAAGWLIETAGLKGYREGNVGVSGRQALVILNYGNASGKEVYEFSQKIKNLILKKFNISLQTEVNIL